MFIIQSFLIRLICQRLNLITNLSQFMGEFLVIGFSIEMLPPVFMNILSKFPASGFTVKARYDCICYILNFWIWIEEYSRSVCDYLRGAANISGYNWNSKTNRLHYSYRQTF